MKRAAPERAIQIAIRDRLRLRGVTAIAVPNAGKRTVVAGMLLKAEGMFPGFPDLIVLGNEGRVAFLEVKAAKGRLSDAQEDCHDMLKRRGHLVAVVRSQDEAEDVLRSAGWFA